MKDLKKKNQNTTVKRSIQIPRKKFLQTIHIIVKKKKI